MILLTCWLPEVLIYDFENFANIKEFCLIKAEIEGKYL